MSNRQQQPNGPHAAVSGAIGQGALHLKEEEQVRELLARGTTKSAVEQAKEIHKRYHSPASEALLVDAYAARIRSLMEHTLTAEAKALFDLVCERYACAREKFAQIRIIVAGCQAGFDDLVRPLNDPAIAVDLRAGIEDTLKRQVTDLSALAQCAALSPGHPLRVGARALQKAVEAVTSGPATDSDLILPEAPRRGVLAPWKMLVRAIAYFYRKDDAACERCLQAIDPGSAPARLVPAIRAMLSQKFDESLQSASVGLTRQVGGNMEVLRGALERLDGAFNQKKGRARIFPAIHEAISACRNARPEMLDRLRQHISIRATRLDLPIEKVRNALGGPSTKDAYFWRLFARSAETSQEPVAFTACSMWEEFRRHAVAEGWFAEEGPEAAALCLHMAELLRRMPHEELAGLRSMYMARFSGYDHYYKDQDSAIRAVAAKFKELDFYFLFPEQLFERACAMDPHREAFEQWIDWAETETRGKEAERAAESWRRSLRTDSRPLLYLMEAAEKRGALNKAFKLLEEAEQLDSLNPEVRRAALRLLVGQAIRHVRQRKAHLVEQDLASLEPLPQAQEGDRPAFLAALRWTCCVIRGDAEAALNCFTKVGDLVQSPAAATLVCGGAGEACGFGRNEISRFLPPEASLEPAASMAAAVARVCSLGDDMGVPFSIPAEWESRVFKELSKPQSGLDARELRVLGEAALRRDRRELAYAASTAGFTRGGDTEGRFLLLRARALPEWEFERRGKCIAAAAELGRRRRDMGLVNEAVDLRRGRRSRRANFFDWIDQLDEGVFPLTTERLNAVLQLERQSPKFPPYRPAPFRGTYRGDPFVEDEWKDDDEEEEIDPQDLNVIGEFARELEQLLEGKRPKGTPRKQRRNNVSDDLRDQGDLPF